MLHSVFDRLRKDTSARLLLTWNGSQVEIISDHLLQLVVHRSFLKLKTQVVPQIFVNDFAYKRKPHKTKLSDLQSSIDASGRTPLNHLAMNKEKSEYFAENKITPNY